MDLLHPLCAGVDVSKRDAKVCVRIARPGRTGASSTVTTWSSMTGQILALREHLIDQQVTVVVMEATGDYWKPFYYLARGRPLRAGAGQRPAGQEGPRPQDRCVGRDLAGAAWRARLGPRIIRALCRVMHRRRLAPPPEPVAQRPVQPGRPDRLQQRDPARLRHDPDRGRVSLDRRIQPSTLFTWKVLLARAGDAPRQGASSLVRSTFQFQRHPLVHDSA